MNNPDVHEAAKQFYETLKKMNLKDVVIIYSYDAGDEKTEETSGGWWGYTATVIGVCERTKNQLLFTDTTKNE